MFFILANTVGEESRSLVYTLSEMEITQNPVMETEIPVGIMDTESILTWRNHERVDGDVVVISVNNYTVY